MLECLDSNCTMQLLFLVILVTQYIYLIKYIAANYKVDSEKLASFIKKYLKSAVASGELVQTKGKGASGSFKLSSGKPEKAPTVVTTARGRSSSTSAPKEKKQQQPTKAKLKSSKKRR
ncbi:Histone H1 [Zootermopsis nevadensis]|uniref:Histone H1 n=1 Tax=Zootermopsis nevadensis TaxID=136037 RepID=A0A067QH47_ZOONE|nr:Histone H1 [Zootermopsis nevadensis]